MKLGSKLIIAVVFCTSLLYTPPLAIASNDVCKEPSQEIINRIKNERVEEINSLEIVKSGEERKMKLEDVIIDQAYEKDGLILVSYRFNCCFEGMVLLYKKTKNGIKSTAYHNGYDNKGVFVGFEKKLVVQTFSKHVPQKARKMLDCYTE